MTEPLGPDAHLGLDRIADLEEGLLSPAQEQAAREHLAGCDICQADLAALAAVHEALLADAEIAMPDDIAARVYGALAELPPLAPAVAAATTLPVRTGPSRWERSRRPLLATLAAAACIALLTLGIIHLPRGSGSSASSAAGTSAAAAAPTSAAGPQILHSGHDYNAKTLGADGQALVAPPVAAAPTSEAAAAVTSAAGAAGAPTSGAVASAAAAPTLAAPAPTSAAAPAPTSAAAPVGTSAAAATSAAAPATTSAAAPAAPPPGGSAGRHHRRALPAARPWGSPALYRPAARVDHCAARDRLRHLRRQARGDRGRRRPEGLRQAGRHRGGAPRVRALLAELRQQAVTRSAQRDRESRNRRLR